MDYNALYKISYGLYVITSRNKDGKYNGLIANTVFQVTSNPPCLAVSINKNNLTHEYIMSSRVLTISILTKEVPIEFIGKFGYRSGRDIEKFKNIDTKKGKTDCEIVLDFANSYLELEVTNTVDVGTHTIFIGKIVDAQVFNEKECITYDFYHKIKGGKSPKYAPTYVNNKLLKGDKVNMKKYVCIVCGYVYDPEKGDPDSGIAPGTSFEDIPEDWVCPICGVDKTQFEIQE